MLLTSSNFCQLCVCTGMFSLYYLRHNPHATISSMSVMYNFIINYYFIGASLVHSVYSEVFQVDESCCMIGRLRMCFPKVFELTLVSCSVCTPRLALNVHELQYLVPK